MLKRRGFTQQAVVFRFQISIKTSTYLQVGAGFYILCYLGNYL